MEWQWNENLSFYQEEGTGWWCLTKTCCIWNEVKQPTSEVKLELVTARRGAFELSVGADLYSEGHRGTREECLLKRNNEIRSSERSLMPQCKKWVSCRSRETTQEAIGIKVRDNAHLNESRVRAPEMREWVPAGRSVRLEDRLSRESRQPQVIWMTFMVSYSCNLLDGNPNHWEGISGEEKYLEGKTLCL